MVQAGLKIEILLPQRPELCLQLFSVVVVVVAVAAAAGGGVCGCVF